jgi:hypothetical protein
MRKFSVRVEDFYRMFPPQFPRADACMRELVERYGIVGKSVLSVGAGSGEEEHRLVLAGNDVLMIELDEGGSIRERMEKLPEGRGLSYWIGDAADLAGALGCYDVIYFSSFTPDEERRQKIYRDNLAAGRYWSTTDEPFHPVVMGYTEKLKAGGLLLVQSYYGGVDTAYEPHYLGACQLQLHRAGLSLLEVHRFKHSRGVTLYTAVKGPTQQASVRPLSAFHGRAAKEPIERIFPAGMVPESLGQKRARLTATLRAALKATLKSSFKYWQARLAGSSLSKPFR